MWSRVDSVDVYVADNSLLTNNKLEPGRLDH